MRFGSRTPEPVEQKAMAPDGPTHGEGNVTAGPPLGRPFRFTPQQEHQATILAAFQTSAELLEDCRRAVTEAQSTADRITLQAEEALARAQKVHAEARQRMRAVAEGKI